MATGGLKRRLGFALLTFYGVGVMIGAGIYVLVGAVAGAVGPWAPIVFVVAGLVVLPTVLSYAELCVRVPESAGEAAYLRAAGGETVAGRLLSVAVGMAVAGVGITSAAVVLQGGAGYLRTLLELPAPVLICALGSFLTLAAIVGVLESLILAAVFTLAEVAGLGVVGFAGALAPAAEASESLVNPSLPGVSGVASAILLAFFAFIGFEDMVNMVEETRDPAQTMPRAIIAALAITAAVYALVSWAAIKAVPPAELAASASPLVLVYERATGQGAGFLAAIAVVAALNGVLAQIVMASRVLYGLGRREALFAIFHHGHPRFGTPVLATVVTGACVLSLALTMPLVDLAFIVSFVLLGVFVAVNLALLVLKRRGGPRPAFAVPVWVPALGAVLSFVTITGSLIA
ncbi:MAG: APC family permease [Pseudomonadota bacterium]